MLEDSPAWRRCEQEGAAVVRCDRPPRRRSPAGGISAAFTDLSGAERRRILGVLRLEELRRDGVPLSDDEVEALVLRTVPAAAQVRPDIALTLPGAEGLVDVSAVIDGRTRPARGGTCLWPDRRWV